jgi:hypothetical protein
MNNSADTSSPANTNVKYESKVARADGDKVERKAARRAAKSNHDNQPYRHTQSPD